MDKFRIDSHKMMYHAGRVGAWLQGDNVYPIYIETSPSGACNHRCRFCGKDFMKYQRRFLDWDMFRERLAEMGRLGVKSIMHAGEGEPLLHKHMAEIIQAGKAAGIDQALNTNGVLFTPEKAEAILPHAQWVRVSFDAGTRDTYAYLHRTQPGDFDTVIENLQQAAQMRRANGWACALGLQMILLPENRTEAVTLAGIARDIGMDYLAIKPYSQHPLSITDEYREVSYEQDLALAEELRRFNTPDFTVVFRAHAMRKWDEAARSYDRCYAMSFWTYIDAAGKVWGCCNYLGDERFLLGNLYENTFGEIWNGEQRRAVIAWVQNEMDAHQCRINCRMDEVNLYLWDLKHPPDHVNFI
ncbi:MAG TPA: radical SAM/SPASM domain-containing protein [Candidatus Hydrogenedentes bacterium]|nr:radical SAM/SPASM domain-containing protein [Candidatus Hydrogenedentota bacterium]